jgi:hypothetical protein
LLTDTLTAALGGDTLPASSVARTVTEWAPLPTDVEFQLIW